MNLSSSEVALVLAGCVVLIGAVWALYQRGVFGPAKVTQPPAHDHKHEHKEVAKH